jgi:hypothetical protein
MGNTTHYGVNADGSLSVCRAKPGNVGTGRCHHGKHVDFSRGQYLAYEEGRAASVSAAETIGKSRHAVIGAKEDAERRVDESNRILAETVANGDPDAARRMIRESGRGNKLGLSYAVMRDAMRGDDNEESDDAIEDYALNHIEFTLSDLEGAQAHRGAAAWSTGRLRPALIAAAHREAPRGIDGDLYARLLDPKSRITKGEINRCEPLVSTEREWEALDAKRGGAAPAGGLRLRWERSARHEEGWRVVPPPAAGVNADIERS